MPQTWRKRRERRLVNVKWLIIVLMRQRGWGLDVLEREFSAGFQMELWLLSLLGPRCIARPRVVSFEFSLLGVFVFSPSCQSKSVDGRGTRSSADAGTIGTAGFDDAGMPFITIIGRLARFYWASSIAETAEMIAFHCHGAVAVLAMMALWNEEGTEKQSETNRLRNRQIWSERGTAKSRGNEAQKNGEKNEKATTSKRGDKQTRTSLETKAHRQAAIPECSFDICLPSKSLQHIHHAAARFYRPDRAPTRSLLRARIQACTWRGTSCLPENHHCWLCISEPPASSDQDPSWDPSWFWDSSWSFDLLRLRCNRTWVEKRSEEWEVNHKQLHMKRNTNRKREQRTDKRSKKLTFSKSATMASICGHVN